MYKYTCIDIYTCITASGKIATHLALLAETALAEKQEALRYCTIPELCPEIAPIKARIWTGPFYLCRIRSIP